MGHWEVLKLPILHKRTLEQNKKENHVKRYKPCTSAQGLDAPQVSTHHNSSEVHGMCAVCTFQESPSSLCPHCRCSPLSWGSESVNIISRSADFVGISAACNCRVGWPDHGKSGRHNAFTAAMIHFRLGTFPSTDQPHQLRRSVGS